MAKFYVRYNVLGFGDQVTGPYEGRKEADEQAWDLRFEGVSGIEVVPAEEVEAPQTRFDIIG